MKRLGLRARIFLLVALLTSISLAGAAYTFWYVNRLDRLQDDIVTRDLSALLASQGLEHALVMQKGLVTYFYLTGDESWLQTLGQYHQEFLDGLEQARRRVFLPVARDTLNAIESAYLRYVYNRDHVIDLYREGRRDEGEALHWNVRDQFHAITSLTNRFQELHRRQIEDARELYRREKATVTALIISSVAAILLSVSLLAFVMYRRIFQPIRQFVALGGRSGQTDTNGENGADGDEILALGQRLRNLLDDASLANTQLRESRRHLLEAEKMAMVGRLAAGVAHTVRNPLTSVKMRLFSLERSLQLNDPQAEDFEVINEEIGHIDTILRNFLEFARPPKLRFQESSPSEVVDSCLRLLRHRLESSGIQVRLERAGPLPALRMDPERLKEGLTNLLVNAAEAMREGGSLTIVEDVGSLESIGPVARIAISDTGPGVPAPIKAKVFEPFYSTKEEGSGLGLAIARRIMEEHGGWLTLASQEGYGATFTLIFPLGPPGARPLGRPDAAFDDEEA